MLVASATQAFAGGLLTNTNQNIAFLRNPARDGVIAIDGVYTNPAGVAFLGDGLHLSINWQMANQKRTIESTNTVFFPLNVNNSATTKNFEGKAFAPVIPSIQAAYNKNKWSLQFNFAIHGGGGKCTFDNGIGTFDEALGKIALGLKDMGAMGYNADSYMQGRQYYFGFTVGAAYKVTDNLSVYGGLRALYGSASYKARIENIKIKTANGDVPFNQFLIGGNAALNSKYDMLKNIVGATSDEQMTAIYGQLKSNYENLPDAQKEIVDNYEKIKGGQASLAGLSKYADGVNLQSDQEGFGIAPIIGVDYKIGNFNFAGKYEFRTRMSLTNESTLEQAGILEPLKKFEDGTSIREDNPAMLSLGAQWSALPNLRINAGYHHFYDTDSKKYADAQKDLSGGTNEYLGGVEWDTTDKLTISGGFQITKYGLTDAFMNDMSFVVDSWSFGAGVKYQINEKVAVNAAYFQTNYDNYKASTNANYSVNEYNRTNRVIGVGVDLKF